VLLTQQHKLTAKPQGDFEPFKEEKRKVPMKSWVTVGNLFES